MFRRATISALITLSGVLTATATPLNPELKNSTFQPGNGDAAPIVARPAVIKRASTSFWKRLKLWRDTKVQPINAAPQPPVKVEVNRFTFNKAPEAAVPAPEARPAGGGH